MLSNYFTLLNVSRSIHDQCVGRKISEVYSQQKQQLCIVVESRPVCTIVVSCEASHNYLYIHEGNFRARKNSVDLFPAACGMSIQNVVCDSSDRVVVISTEKDLSVECEMFGSRANIFLWKSDNTVPVSSQMLIDVFLRKSELHGSRRAPKARASIPPYLRMISNEPEFYAAMRSNEAGSLIQSLKNSPGAWFNTCERNTDARRD